jgi:hypothetical protein
MPARLRWDLVGLDVVVYQHRQQDAGLQRRAVTSGLITPLDERLELAWERVEAGGDDDEVVGVARRDGERLLFAAATDQDRNAIAIAARRRSARRTASAHRD